MYNLAPHRDSYTNGWSGSWVKWYYEMAYLKGWYMVYPNFPNERSFSTNHADVGVHVSSEQVQGHATATATPNPYAQAPLRHSLNVNRAHST